MIIFREIWQILNNTERKKIVLSLFPLTLGMILEMASLGVIIPAIYVIIKPDIYSGHPMIQSILAFLGNPSHETIVILGMLALVLMYTIKTLFLTFLNWKQNKLIFDIKANISYRLFRGYLTQPWIFHSQRNSAHLIVNATHEVNVFINGAILSSIILLTEGLVFFGVMLILFFVQPLGTLLVISVAAIIALLYKKITSKRIAIWAKKRQHHDTFRTFHIQEGLGAAKDIKLLGREEYFFKQFQTHNYGSTNVNKLLETLQQIPRLWFELLAVIILATLVLIMIYQGKSADLILPILGLYAAAAFRVLPSMNRIFGALHLLEFSKPATNTLYNELKILKSVPKAESSELLDFKNLITMENICYKYPNTKSEALNDISLQIPIGYSVGFIGTSGAGKSTLIDIFLGLLTPSNGQIKADGIDIQKNLRGWQDQIGFVPQTIFLSDNTLRANVAFGIPEEMINEKAVKRAIKTAQLEEFVDSLPDKLETRIGERGVRLSGGQRQRIGIARALYHDPKILVFDESTNSLDHITENAIMESINALRGLKTLIIIAHRLSTVEHCNVIYKIEKGKIVAQGDFKSIVDEKAMNR